MKKIVWILALSFASTLSAQTATPQYMPRSGGTFTQQVYGPGFDSNIDPSYFSGSSTLARINSAMSALPTVSGTPVGQMTIPASEPCYDQTANPMSTSGQTNVTIFDYRAPCSLRSGYPRGGVMVGDGSDWAWQNYMYFYGNQIMWIGGQYNASNYPANTQGHIAMQIREDYLGTPNSSAIQANDGLGVIAAVDPGYQTAVTRTFTSSIEAQCDYVGNYSGSTPGAAVEVYDQRCETLNFVPQNPGTGNGIIGNLVELDTQPLSVATLESTFRFGGWRGIHAEAPAVPQANVCMSGSATVTNGSVVLTYLAGNHFSDRLMIQNRPLWIGTTAQTPTGTDVCGKPGGTVTPYSIGSSPNPQTLSVQQAITQPTGTVYWTMYGSEFAIEADDTMHFNLSLKANNPFYLDPLCNCGGAIFETNAGNMSEAVWFVNSQPAALSSAGIYPATGMAEDLQGYLHWYNGAGTDRATISQAGDFTIAGNLVAGDGSNSVINALTVTSGLTVSASTATFGGNVLLTHATAVAASGQVGLGTTTAGTSSCGSLAGSTLCWTVNVGGTTYYIPLYN